MRKPNAENSLSVILADLRERLERIEVKLNLLKAAEEPEPDQLQSYGYFEPNPKAEPKRHRQPWE